MDKPLMKETEKLLAPDDVAKTPETDPRRKTLRLMERAVYIIGIVGMAVVLMFGYSDNKMKLKKAGVLIEELAHDKIDLKTKLSTVKSEIYELKEKLANLKNKEDLAKRDLEAYILRKYRVIPKVVAHEMAAQTVKLTKELGVPFSLIVGLTEVESQFKPWAISKKGARGPMQVMPFWVKKKKSINLEIDSKYDLHDISTGITAGIKVFKYHLKEANNDINQGLYLYVGKDRAYANKVFNAMGRFEVFRSTLDTSLRDGASKEVFKDKEKTPPKKKLSLKRLTKQRVKLSLKRLTFNEEAYARA